MSAIVFTIPIPPGFSAAIVGSNVVFTFVGTAPAPLSIKTPFSLPQAKVGVPYSASLASIASPSGGVPPYIFKPVSGFPSWSKLSPDGTLTGTPTTSGALTLNFSVTDSSGGTQSAQAQHVVAVAPSSSPSK